MRSAVPDDHVIGTARLELRVMSAELLVALAAGDNARAAALGGFAIDDVWSDRDRAHARARAGALRRDPALGPWLSRAIVERQSQTLVGRVGFHDRPDAAGAVEIGYAVFAPYRRRGYASEAAAALIEWAEAHDIARVVASVSPENHASLGVIARLGFTRTGERIDPHDGLEHVFTRLAHAATTRPGRVDA